FNCTWAGPWLLGLCRSGQTLIVVFVLTDPVNYRTHIQATSPSVSRAIVEDTKIGPMPWERTGEREGRRDKLTSDPESFWSKLNPRRREARGSSRRDLKFSPGEPGAVNCSRQPAPIPVAKDRRIQNIDRFVVETFEYCPGKVSVGIDDQINRPTPITGNLVRATKNQRPVLLNTRGRGINQDDRLRAERCYNVAHINMPPISTQCQALYPFRAVNHSVGPFVRRFWMVSRISQNTFLDLRLSLSGKRICNDWEVLRGSRRDLRKLRRMERLGITTAQGQRADI